MITLFRIYNLLLYFYSTETLLANFSVISDYQIITPAMAPHFSVWKVEGQDRGLPEFWGHGPLSSLHKRHWRLKCSEQTLVKALQLCNRQKTAS